MNSGQRIYNFSLTFSRSAVIRLQTKMAHVMRLQPCGQQLACRPLQLPVAAHQQVIQGLGSTVLRFSGSS